VPLEPVAAQKQRAALNLIAETVFAADNFRFQPAFLSKLAISDREIDDARDLAAPYDHRRRRRPAGPPGATCRPRSAPRAEVAQRLLNNELKVSAPKAALRLADLYSTLHVAIFSELKSGQDIPLIRRNCSANTSARGGRARASGADDARRRARTVRADAVQLRRRDGSDAEAATDFRRNARACRR